MPLETQEVSLPFTQGLDSKTSRQLSAKPSLVQDMVFVGGTLEKRPGTEPLSSTMDTGGSFRSGDALFTLGNELVRIDGDTTYGLAPATNTWTAKSGGQNYCTLTRQRIQRNTATQSSADQATLNGITVFAWLETGGPQKGLHIASYDENAGTFYITGAVAARATNNTLNGTRCIVIGKRIVVLHGDVTSGVVYGAYVDTTAPGTVSSFVALKSDLWTGAASGGKTIMRLDALTLTVSGTQVGVCSYMSSDADLTTFTFSDALAVTATATSAGVVTAGEHRYIYLQKTTNGNLFHFFGDASANRNYYLVLSSALASVKAKTVIGTTSVFLTCTTYEETANAVSIWGSAASADDVLYEAIVTSASVSQVFTAVSGSQACFLVSDAFLYDGVVCAVFQNATINTGVNTMPTCWVASMTGIPLARFLTGVAGLINTTASSAALRLSRPCTIPSGATSFLAYERGQLAYEGLDTPIDVTPVGLSRALVMPVAACKLPVVSMNGVAHVGGGLPRAYDGQQVTEDGIPIPPIELSSVGASAAPGSLDDGQYQMVALWSWVDAQGQLVRSPVSPPVSFTATAGQAWEVLWYPLPLSSRDKLPAGATVQIEFYRTQANGSLFYRDSSVSSPTYNILTGGGTTYTTTQSDAALAARELLYTTGGVMDWLSPPAYSCSCAHKDRLIVAGLEDPYSWQSSSQSIPSQALRFNEAWGGRVPAETGPITAVASMDGNLIVFTTQAAYLVQGDGPDLLGNNNWPPPQRITSVDSGAVSWQSVVSTNAGILYQSSRGFSLLDRSLSCPPEFGSEVQRYGNWVVRSGLSNPTLQRVYYQVDVGAGTVGQLQPTGLTSWGGACLVYDYFYGQWSVFSNYDAQSACLYQGKYTRAKWSGAIRQEMPGTYGDNFFAHFNTTPSTVETPWVKVGDIQGFQRVRRILLLGTFGSPCTVTLEAAYNYNESYTDSCAFSGSGILTPGGPLQFRWKPSLQKCEAVKFRITDSNISGSGKGMALTGLSLEVGIKRGPFKLQASQSL